METINKKALAEILAEKTGATKKDALQTVDILFDEIKDTLKAGGKIDISGFGKFEVKHKPARMGINPATKQPTPTAAKDVPAFKAAKALKDALLK